MMCDIPITSSLPKQCSDKHPEDSSNNIKVTLFLKENICVLHKQVRRRNLKWCSTR